MLYPLFIPVSTGGREPLYQGVEVDPSLLPWWCKALEVAYCAVLVLTVLVLLYAVIKIVCADRYGTMEDGMDARNFFMSKVFSVVVLLTIIVVAKSLCIDNWKYENIDPETGKLKNQVEITEQLPSETSIDDDYVSIIIKQILQNGEEVNHATVLKYAAAQCDRVSVENGETVFMFGDQKLSETELYQKFDLG